jgi:hypothetical protein
MTIEAEVQKIMDDALPAIVKSMGKIATDANASATDRLEAMGILLRVSEGRTTALQILLPAATPKLLSRMPPLSWSK